jgi:hypothetical protein
LLVSLPRLSQVSKATGFSGLLPRYQKENPSRLLKSETVNPNLTSPPRDTPRRVHGGFIHTFENVCTKVPHLGCILHVEYRYTILKGLSQPVEKNIKEEGGRDGWDIDIYFLSALV